MTKELTGKITEAYGLENIYKEAFGGGLIYWVYCKQCPDTSYFWGIDQSRGKMEKLRIEHMEQNPGHDVVMSWFDLSLP